MNTFGRNLRLTTFGESHGPAVGGVLDGLPAGLRIDFDEIERQVARRRPGQSALTTARTESDMPEWLSGISPEGITLGTPIAFMTRNRDQRSKDYDAWADMWRPNHADFTYEARYGIRDHRGGGRASARETFARVVAAAIVRQWLDTRDINIEAALCGAGKEIATGVFDTLMYHPELSPCLDITPSQTEAMYAAIARAKATGDSIGGSVAVIITGLPAGVGSPIYAKLHACLAEAMMSINAAKGFEYGLGMAAAAASGITTADIFTTDSKNNVVTTTNYSGGIQGGISNGMPIYFRVAFKPTPTVMQSLPTLTRDRQPTTLPASGRHDPCVALRAVPVVEAMTVLTIADALLSDTFYR
ncbi:MAG: chorismate synthase [Muribaculaceae bacterium]|nr:chorismate synthase [Muribaculaceae bacterium]